MKQGGGYFKDGHKGQDTTYPPDLLIDSSCVQIAHIITAFTVDRMQRKTNTQTRSTKCQYSPSFQSFHNDRDGENAPKNVIRKAQEFNITPTLT